MDAESGEPLSSLARAKERSDRVDLLVQLVALVRDLALALAGRRGLEPEVDLVVQMTTHLRQPSSLGLEDGELSAEIVDAEIVHGAAIGRVSGDFEHVSGSEPRSGARVVNADGAASAGACRAPGGRRPRRAPQSSAAPDRG